MRRLRLCVIGAAFFTACSGGTTPRVAALHWYVFNEPSGVFDAATARSWAR